MPEGLGGHLRSRGRSLASQAMPVHLALLRAVNVAGHGMLRMGDVPSFLKALGFREPRTLLQTGNLVFEGGRRGGTALEKHLAT